VQDIQDEAVNMRKEKKKRQRGMAPTHDKVFEKAAGFQLLADANKGMFALINKWHARRGLLGGEQLLARLNCYW